MLSCSQFKAPRVVVLVRPAVFRFECYGLRHVFKQYFFLIVAIQSEASAHWIMFGQGNPGSVDITRTVVKAHRDGMLARIKSISVLCYVSWPDTFGFSRFAAAAQAMPMTSEQILPPLF